MNLSLERRYATSENALGCCAMGCCPDFIDRSTVLRVSIHSPKYLATHEKALRMMWSDSIPEVGGPGWVGRSAPGEPEVVVALHCVGGADYGNRFQVYTSFTPILEPTYLNCCHFELMTDYNFTDVVELTIVALA